MRPQSPMLDLARAAARGRLPAYMVRQRWYQRRAEAPERAEVVGLAFIHPGLCWAVIELFYPSSTPQAYSVPLCVCEAAAVPPEATIAEGPEGQVLADAVHHGDSRRALLASLLGKAPPPQSLLEGRFVVGGGAPVNHHPQETGRLMGAEQSNTSLVFAAGSILKLFRTLQDGPNPDLEMTEYLSVAQGLTCVPRLAASLTFAGSGRDGRPLRLDLAMVQGLVDHAEDLWQATVNGLQAWLRGGAAGDAPGMADATALGRATRTCHQALAAADDRPDFAPRRAAAPDHVAWLGAAIAQADTALATLRQNARSLPAALQPQAAALLELAAAGGQAHWLERVVIAGEQVDVDDLGLCIRHHGDFHLAQVLRRDNGAMVILDFEGEPLRPLAARRQPHSPLRDVAGMLRSYDYAAQTCRNAGPLPGLPVAARDAAIDAWAAAIARAFVAAYMAPAEGAHAPNLLPREGAARQRLLRLFCLEKACYELVYELSHRPAWVGVPLTALLSLARGRP